MKKRLIAALEAVRSPRVKAFMGLLMALSGAVEALTPFLEKSKGHEATVGAHHGVLLYGLYVFLHSLGEVMGGAKEIREGLRLRREAEAEAAERPAAE